MLFSRYFIYLSTLVIIFLLVGMAYADRLYGNFNFSYQHIKQTNQEVYQDDLTQENLFINYEDVLFTKNNIRLALSFNRREFSNSNYHEFLPIYYFDLNSYGYSFSTSYSPYKRLSAVGGFSKTFDVFYRDWRNTFVLNYEKWPTFSLVYNRNKSFDKEPVRRYDSQSRNLVLQSNYSYKSLSWGVNYNDLNQINNIVGALNSKIRSYNGTIGFNRVFPKVGFTNLTYNYYNTRRYIEDNLNSKSYTHTINIILSSFDVYHLSSNFSYSGSFFQSHQSDKSFNNDNQNFSAQINYAPFGYLNLQAVKGYQINSQSGTNQVVEYLAYVANFTRYLRRGVDTRLTFNRTVFQQSNRIVFEKDSLGNVVQANKSGGYLLDTYYASLGFSPFVYIKSYYDISIARNSDPIDPLRRYQLTQSVNTKVKLTQKIEGRFVASSLYEGDRLRLGKSYSETYNLGVNYIPENNININVSYIYSQYNSALKSRNSSFTGYFSYSFRHAFSVYYSFNQQVQKRDNISDVTNQNIEEVIKPRTTNGQLLIYLSRKTTVTFNYLQNKYNNLNNQQILYKSLQMVINYQL
ncbi:MAG: hypothetical protein GXO93_04030 [FCB group bacterium]|nr:hypothetical protein [FCB group bacterium]